MFDPLYPTILKIIMQAITVSHEYNHVTLMIMLLKQSCCLTRERIVNQLCP